MVDRVAYDEFGLFHENAREYGLPFDEPPTVRREFVEVEPGRSLSALVWGTTEPELVFLHGGGQNAHTWDTVILALGRPPALAVDLPGHGHSGDPGSGQMLGRGPVGAAQDVAVVVRQLAPNAKAVVGMSFGALTAIALTNVAPELVRKVVLVDALPGLKAENARHIVEFINGPVSFPDFDDLLRRTQEFNPTRTESSLRRGILHNALQLDDGSWVWRHQRWRAIDGEQPPKEVPAQPLADQQALYEELWRYLDEIEVPLMLCRGMRPDSVLRDDDEDELRARRPHATVVRFEEAGHSIQGDDPLGLAAAIRNFVY